jgi:transcription elongation factor GreB
MSSNKEKNYITPQGFKKLKDELDYLLRIERPEVTKTVTWAAGNGDRSENADYIYGKKRMREIDKRVRFLTSRLDAAHVVDPATITSIRIQFGATVKLSDEDGAEKTISIVGIDEINTEKGHLSWRSPIGSSLIGKVEGESIIVRTPKGELEYEIIEIIYRNIHED